MGAKAARVADLLEGLVKAFDAARVRYALCGGWAVAFWGHARLTTDIDLFIVEEDLRRGIDALKPVGFLFEPGRIPLPAAGIEFHRVSGIVDGEVVPVDMYPVAADHKCLANAGVVQWRGLDVPILDIDDLIEMKQRSERSKDKGDVDELLRIREEMNRG